MSVAVALTAAACTDDPESSPGTVVTIDLPDGPPTVTGVVVLSADSPDPRLGEPSDPYYDGMSLADAGDRVQGADGKSITVDQLEEGDQVAVWTEGGCRESSPVQCDIAAVQVLP